MAPFNKDTAHEELVQHALEKTTETGITDSNKAKLKLALEEKATDGKLKIKIETEKELNILKETIVNSLKLKKVAGLTEVEIQEVAKNIITASEKPETSTETADTTATAPETTPANQETPVKLGDITTQVPESYQKEVKNYIMDNRGFAGMVMKGLSNWVTEIIKGIKGFFATFGIEDEGEKKDALAQINGFEDAEEERRVTASVKALKSSPITKGPPLSDILKISHISNEDLTKILKDNPGLDFSSTKNIEAAFTGKYRSNDRELMKRYDRIFFTLQDIHGSLDPSEPYNATNKFKEILAGSNKADLDDRISETALIGVSGVDTGKTESPSLSPEKTEINNLEEAKKIDKELGEAKNLPNISEEDKNIKEEAIKNAQEKIEKITKKAENGRQEIGIELTNLEKERENKNKEIEKVRNKNIQPSDLDYDKVQEEMKRLEEEQKTTDLKIIELKKIQEKVKDMKNITAEDAYGLITVISESTYDAEYVVRRNIEKPDNIEKIKLDLNIMREKFKRKNIPGFGTAFGPQDTSEAMKVDDIITVKEGMDKIVKYAEDADVTNTEEYKNLKKVVECAQNKLKLMKALAEKIYDIENNWGGCTVEWGNDTKINDPDHGWIEIDGDELQIDVNQSGWNKVKDDFSFVDKENSLVNYFGGLQATRTLIINNLDSVFKDKQTVTGAVKNLDYTI